MAPGREERDECRAEQTRRTRHRHLEPGPVAKAGVVPQVGWQHPMSIGEHPLDARPRHPHAGRGAQGTEGRRELDPVSGDGGVGAQRVEAMEVEPMVERSFDLFVRELAARDEVPMHRDPANGHRPRVDPQDDTAAVRNPPGALQHLDALPGRREPLERSGPRVPREGLLGCHGQPALTLDDEVRRCHRRRLPLHSGHDDAGAHACPHSHRYPAE